MRTASAPLAMGKTTKNKHYIDLVIGRVPSITAVIAGLTLCSLCYLWLYLVHKNVPEPYLDEVFHIRQAQTYCTGNFIQWDPKITTPPGIYIVSLLLRFQRVCSIELLRNTNAFLLCIGLFPLTLVLCLRRDVQNFQDGKHLSAHQATLSFSRCIHTLPSISVYSLRCSFSVPYTTQT